MTASAGGAPANRPVLGALWMFGAVVSFALMQIAARELYEEHGPLDVMVFRCVVGLALIVPIGLAFGGVDNLITRRPLGHLIRNTIHFGGQFGWFYGIAYLAMADVTALTSSTPIFGVILAVMFLGERMTWPRAMVIGCGFVGVMLVIRPGFIPIELAAGVTVLGALCYAISMIMVKALTRTEPALRIVFYMMAMQLVIAVLATGGDLAMPKQAHWPHAILVGICGLTAHYAMAKAVTVADASVVMPVGFLQLPAMALAGYLIYAEALDPFTLAGGAIILGATYLNVVWSQRRRR